MNGAKGLAPDPPDREDIGASFHRQEPNIAKSQEGNHHKYQQVRKQGRYIWAAPHALGIAVWTWGLQAWGTREHTEGTEHRDAMRE